MFPLPIHIYFECCALLTCILCWRGLKATSLKWLLPFMFFMVGVEFVGRYLRVELKESNAFLYNISVPVEFIFYGLLFYLHFQHPFQKRLAKWFVILFILFVLLNLFWLQGFIKFNTNVLKLGSFCMILLSAVYFVELLNRDTDKHILAEPMFWVACGVFLFNTGEFLYSLFSDYLISKHMDLSRKIFSCINNNLIWVLYTCISISSICTMKLRKV